MDAAAGRAVSMGMTLTTTRSIADLQAEAERPSLRRVLGPLNLTALGIGSVIGTGIFVLTGTAASQNAGPALVLSMIIAATACALAGLCYAELASMIPVAGSAYTYAYASSGELVAWITVPIVSRSQVPSAAGTVAPRTVSAPLRRSSAKAKRLASWGARQGRNESAAGTSAVAEGSES
jgi:hypothetical protein